MSFGFNQLYEIQRRKTIVCEKTDGMRFLLIEVIYYGQPPMVFLVDRQYRFRIVWHYHPSEASHHLPKNTNISKNLTIANIFDGELVFDKAWRKGQENSIPIFLIFDCLVANTFNLIALPFS